MPDIVVAEFMDEAALATLRETFEVHYQPDLGEAPDELVPAIAQARALIVRNRTQVTADLLDAAPALKAVGRLGVGLDNIDIEACAERGVTVHPAIGANSGAVAEFVIAALLTLWRPVMGATADLVAGRWPRTELVGAEVAGRTLGLLGFGDIAREIAHRARALGMSVQAHDPYLPADDPAWAGIANVSRSDLLDTSDAVSLHVPLTPETAGSINAETLSAMRPGALLINTARGGIVDEDALVAALSNGDLGGAAIDVFSEEPIANPARFANVPNLILTPHIAGLTIESQQRVGAVVAEAVRATLSGE